MKRSKRSKRIKFDKGDIDLSILFGGDRRPKVEKIRHVGALYEDLHSKIDLVIEGMEATRTSLEGKIGDFREEVNGRFEIIEGVLKMHSKDINELKTTVAEHGVKLDKVQKTVDEHTIKLAGHTIKLDNIEKSVQRIETTFGEKLDDHETRITTLETTQP